MHSPLNKTWCFLHSRHSCAPLPACQSQLRHTLSRWHLQPLPGLLPPTRTRAVQVNGSSHRPPMLPTRYRVMVAGQMFVSTQRPSSMWYGFLHDVHSTKTPLVLARNCRPSFACFLALHRLHRLMTWPSLPSTLHVQGTVVPVYTLPLLQKSSFLHTPDTSHDDGSHLTQTAPCGMILLLTQSPRIFGLRQP